MVPTDPYRNVAGLYDRIFEPMNRGLRLLGLRMHRPFRDMAILDVGCGTGIHLEIYQRYGCQLHGIDISPAMLEVAKARLGEGADLRLADATQMPYDDEVFDLVLCMLSLHEMDETMRDRVIHDIKRVLKIDGRILLIDYHAGKSKPLNGWITKLVILVAEIAAGRRHYRNYRHFMAVGGLPMLIQHNYLVVEKERIVGGDTLALYLLRKG